MYKRAITRKKSSPFHLLKIGLALLLLFFTLGIQAHSNEGNNTISLSVSDKDSKETILMATAKLEPLQAMAVTDMDGKAAFHKVPKGTYQLIVTYVGYEEYKSTIKVSGNLNLTIKLTPTSLSLKEVSVIAQRKSSGASTTSLVSRQAIDHLQATSLADIMQLIPGQEMGNIDLTQQKNLQLRTLSNNATSAFGSSIVVDGVPMSNNGAVSQGQFSSSAFAGTDLRQIAADDINSVEVIRGIPSAEYGDLTSGLVVVHSKVECQVCAHNSIQFFG